MFGTYQRLNVHVSATDREVIKAATRKLSREAFKAEHRAFRREFYAGMLRYHAAARRLYAIAMGA